MLGAADPVFASAARTVMLAWAIGSVIFVGAIYLTSSNTTSTATLVSVASGIVSLMALIPGLVHHQPNDYSGPLLASVMLRIIGTVALFALCRYQMAASAESIAAMCLGWYIYLTVIGVGLLAYHMSHRDDIVIPSSS